MDVQINVLAVVLAAASSMAVGAAWYAKGAFGKTWMKLVNLDDKKMAKGAAQAIGLTFVASLVTAYVLAHVTALSSAYFGNSYMYDALMTAFWLWLGLTAARILVHDLFERRNRQLTIINVSHELVTLLVMAIIIGALKP